MGLPARERAAVVVTPRIGAEENRGGTGEENDSDDEKCSHGLTVPRELY